MRMSNTANIDTTLINSFVEPIEVSVTLAYTSKTTLLYLVTYKNNVFASYIYANGNGTTVHLSRVKK